MTTQKQDKNQCDGCNSGLPFGLGLKAGLHVHALTGNPIMACTKSLYKTLDSLNFKD